jgi:CheY-like chemotaxis protein
LISKDEVKKRKENMSDIRILCVDDDISMLNTIEDILINAGYAVTLAKSGKQAVEFIKKGIEFQLILLDVDMPEIMTPTQFAETYMI